MSPTTGKSVALERTLEHLKDRTETLDDYLQHVHKWLILFVFTHNSSITKSNAKLVVYGGERT